jgi:hypothetical protein
VIGTAIPVPAATLYESYSKKKQPQADRYAPVVVSFSNYIT